MKRPRFTYHRGYTFTDADGTWRVKPALMISSDGRLWWNLGADFKSSVRKVWRDMWAAS